MYRCTLSARPPNRERAAAFLERNPAEQLVTSAEVIHRYVSIDRRQAIADAFRVLDGIVVRVYSISRADVGSAREIVEEHPELSGRDCLHLAVMRSYGVSRVLTFDRGFALDPRVTVLP